MNHEESRKEAELDSDHGDIDPSFCAGRRHFVIAHQAALFEPRLAEIVVVDPPASHRDGPIFLNVLRVLDVPDALGMLAPRPLAIHTSQDSAFARTASIYRVAGGTLSTQSLP